MMANLLTVHVVAVIFFGLLLQFTTAQTCTSPTTKCDCFIDNKGAKIVNCRYKNLTAIPTFTNTGILYDEIRFNGDTCYVGSGCNNITQLGANAFANLRVKRIVLLNNAIRSINYTAFTSLQDDLESISLEGDGNVDFPYLALAILDDNLITLHLENYGTRVINQSTVMPFPNLQSLTLKNWKNLNDIQAVGFNIMANLTELSLQEMPSLINLPVPAIQKFHAKLTKLEIRDTGLSTLQADVFSPLSALKEVIITSNKNLVSIDNGTFNHVSDRIEILDLDTNRLSSIGFLKSVNWTVLSHLNIGYNFALRTLSAGIFSTMPSLAYLTCHDSGLTSIVESSFLGLGRLHTLDLAYNKITNIGEAAFQHSPNLVELRLNDQSNSVPIVFNTNAFRGIETSLEMLNLDNNLFSIPQFWQDIMKLSNLKTLEISRVGLTAIPDRAFMNNTKLTTIVLSDNQISSVKQETFFGPKETLTTIDLQRNNIRTVHQCTLGDFRTRPKMKLTGNPLHCDCELVWLYDWMKLQPDQVLAAHDIGPCSSPTALQNKMFNAFSRSELCSGSAPIISCPDLYATTTTSTTTTERTTSTTSVTTTVPLPPFDLIVANEYSTEIEVTWSIQDKTYLTGLKLEMKSNNAPTNTQYPGTDAKSYKFFQLQPESYYVFCLTLKINGVYRDRNPSCKQGKTKPSDFTPAPSSTPVAETGETSNQLGIIIGASVGGVVLVGLIIAILVVLLKSNKPKKAKAPTVPVSFTQRADIPHAGGTAKRFQKKGADKEGATPDDINITVISNGEIANRDRISAGSYQALNEKGIDLNPMPPPPYSSHYTNSVENRPLPKAPQGNLGWKERAMGHGYVNTGGASNIPETSKNEYSEARY